jgi:hypothetical protein
MRNIKHDVIGAPALNEGLQLVLNVLGLLASQARYWEISVIALSRGTVAILAVSDLRGNGS